MLKIDWAEDTPDTKIYYTVDGTEPTAQSTEYTAPFKLQARTLKVVAIAGEDQSPVITREYVLMPAMPVASAAAGKLEFGTKIELTCATPGAEIYWMLGGTEQVSKDNGTKYEGPIEIKVSTILKAIAYYNGEASKPMSCKYTVNVAAPAFSAPAGWVAEGTELVMTTESAALDTRPDMKYHIVYTTDGTDPEVESQAGKVVIKNGEEYESPIELTEDVEFKAIAWLRTVKGYDVSPVSSAAYKVLATPTFDRMDGLVEAGTKVVIECATEDAKIYYTTDESEPTAESTPYTAAVVINETTTLKAIAVMEGVSSAVAEAVFMVVSLEAPAFSVAEGEVNHGTELTWTWDEVYNDAFLQVGVIYVANGKDGDLDIDVETYQALYEAGPVEGAHEDGQVYLYMGDEDEPGYTIAKD
ncbi:MAG: chitobiase/beta-hexosaminidase C-terminal domain-containing protein, partial [Bacteroidales bacterium]|nr:chitobiase/beta-hexosaminidase C-terminal domain-containing protein [Bacteroidales bacterium]